MPSVTRLDAEPSKQDRPKVTVRRHPVDWSKVPEATVERINALLADQSDQCVYANPAFTVSSPEPTAAFFREIRKRQAEWCRRASRTFPRSVRRRVSRWGGDDGPFRTKADRYFHRALCYTGVLLVNGNFIYPCNWKRLEGQ